MPEAHRYQKFFAELKRRRVFRVMAVYGAVAFVVLQVADIVLMPLGLPDWTMALVLALTALGFPIAIVLAWAFETTPEGVRRTTEPAPGEISGILEAPAVTRWTIGLAAAGGTALFLVGAWLALGRPTAGGPGGARSADDASIAVLPFANLSGDPQTQPFVDGIHDDLLTQLSKIGGLMVISRTSVLEYRDSPKNVRDIAAELGVSTVLEGGIQRSGEQYRINVQLIDAATDAHLWAEQYGGELTTANIFDVQTKIATAIAAALEASLTPGERANLDRVPTDDLEAYELYLQARNILSINSEANFRTADRVIDRAIERDSSFAEAWAVKSILASYRYFFYFDRSDSVVAMADAMSRRALALSPGLAEGHWARGHYYYRTRLDYDRASEEVRLAVQTRPGDADLAELAGDISRRKGDVQVALSHYQRSARLAPRDAGKALAVGETSYLLRDYRAAEAALVRSVELRPDYADPYVMLALLSVGESGDTAGARRWFEDARAMGAYDHQADFGLFDLEMLERNPAAALATVQAEPTGLTENQFRYLPRTLASGLALRLAGDAAAARAAFETARVELEVLVARDPTEPRYRSALGTALAGLGRNDDAIREGEEGLRLMPPEMEAYRGAYRMMDLARIYAMTGRSDQAVDLLEQLLAMPSIWSRWLLRLDPAWDPLREHPRFMALVAGS